MSALGSIMKRTKQFVPRHFQRSIVTFKVAVMHLMVKRSQLKTILIFNNKLFKSRMRCCRAQRIILQMKQDMDGMGCNHPLDQYRRQKYYMLNRVHRQARPRTDINVTMMRKMQMFIKEFNMQKSVKPIKIKALSDRDK